MRRVELWTEDDRAPLHLDPRVISLEPIRRARHDDEVHNAYDEGTITGFYLGVLAAVLAWLILSGVLLRLMVTIVHGAVRLAQGG